MNFVVDMKCQLISESVVFICLQQMFYNSTLFAIVTGNNGFAYFARARPEKKDWGEMNCEFASLHGGKGENLSDRTLVRVTKLFCGLCLWRQTTLKSPWLCISSAILVEKGKTQA